MKITSIVIITTINAASIAKKMERPIARPTEVDTVAVVEDGSVSNAACVCAGGRCEDIDSIHSKLILGAWGSTVQPRILKIFSGYLAQSQEVLPSWEVQSGIKPHGNMLQMYELKTDFSIFDVSRQNI